MSAETQRLVMPPAAECLADLRRWARSWMEQHPVSGIDLDSVLLSMTELVTNSIKHGAGPVDVELATAEGSLLLGVSDRSDDLPGQLVATPDAEGGRGIVVLEGLATRWGVRSRIAGGKTVWCEFASRQVDAWAEARSATSSPELSAALQERVAKAIAKHAR